MSVTARDIARELNLSQPTVSRILSGDRQHRISESTRQRVLEAASRLEYQPNAVARSLRHGRTNVVGLYTNHNYDARNQFFGTIIGGLQRACEANDLDLLLHSAYRNRSTEDIYGKFRDGRIDGLILHACSDDPLVERLQKSRLPVVAVADALPDLPAVCCDDSDGMRQLVEYLWLRGYRHFTYVAPRLALASVERRRHSFLQSLRSMGASERDIRTVHIDFECIESEFDSLLAGGRHTAVCCWNDRTAYNLLHACLERGVRVPDDLAVTGFDGFRDTSVPTRELVTIHCPWDRVAGTAMELLIRIIGDETDAATTNDICLPVSLLSGDTA